MQVVYLKDMTIFQTLIVLTVILALVFLFVLQTYNMLIKLRNRVKTDFSDIDVQLKRRSSLIQNLMDMVREYASHENDTFKGVAAARSALDNSTSAHETAQAENMLTQSLRSLFMVTEAYPELKADKNFQQLRDDLAGTENRIAIYREEYNKTVEQFNNAVETFPNMLIAGLFAFQAAELFQPTSTADFVVEPKKAK